MLRAFRQSKSWSETATIYFSARYMLARRIAHLGYHFEGVGSNIWTQRSYLAKDAIIFAAQFRVCIFKKYCNMGVFAIILAIVNLVFLLIVAFANEGFKSAKTRQLASIRANAVLQLLCKNLMQFICSPIGYACFGFERQDLKELISNVEQNRENDMPSTDEISKLAEIIEGMTDIVDEYGRVRSKQLLSSCSLLRQTAQKMSPTTLAQEKAMLQNLLVAHESNIDNPFERQTSMISPKVAMHTCYLHHSLSKFYSRHIAALSALCGSELPDKKDDLLVLGCYEVLRELMQVCQDIANIWPDIRDARDLSGQ